METTEACPISSGRCRRCYDKAYREKNRDKRRAARKSYHQQHRDKLNADSKAYREKNPDASKAHYPKYRRERRFWVYSWRQLGILNRAGLPFSLADYDALYELQHGRCLLCDRPPRPGKRLVPDHLHGPDGSGVTRALLCEPCNRVEGIMAANGIDPSTYAARLAVLRLVPALLNDPVKAR